MKAMGTKYASTVSQALRDAPARAGLSLRAFARAVGTSPSRYSTYAAGKVVPAADFYLRALAIADGLGLARAQRLTTPIQATGIIASSLARGDMDWAWRIVLQCRDDLVYELAKSSAAEPPSAAAAWEAAPQASGDRGWDALLAALIGHAFAERGIRPPQWTNVGALETAWQPPHPFLDPTEVRERTPRWLAEANIYVPARDLVTA